ncbi:PP2C family protein-serine/threonine phosphatase [Nocardioides bizhenqiangii]|uniref:Protein phosphatase 2C domain-containing protein n=1 Tax=Nocardioides bizhenqiangii TaxID=3095076 RepID=A0ABZ0ZS06_9ACTN|nr:protein phosphatase 2C domain-containing protein [Nocardioides sp. HM61]WQQ26659.1 protein phosphatase 2C domain-containing protein [Nocardioides sp. HM61]
MTSDDSQLPDQPGQPGPPSEPPPADQPPPPEEVPADLTLMRPVPDPAAQTLPPDGPTVDAPEAETLPVPDDVDGDEREPLRLSYYAISDVGRVRKDNQDSGYAGPWLLAVCDGVGGAARGDIASSTAVNELRQLDERPGSADLLTRVTDALHEAHESIASQVDHDPALSGTSTTATVALFDGQRIAVGHIGDSRGYLFRAGELSQITSDHTFVQSLIDEGRITEEEARIHPHRNLILKALDGLHEVEPDLFAIALAPGDRVFLCSDGACGVLDDTRMADILSSGSPEYAAIELVRASLDAGSSDNVTCVVADVLTEEAAAADPAYDDLEPMVVGAAAELKPRARGLFRGHRSGDTGELEPVDAEIPNGIDYAIVEDPLVDPEDYRYAPLAPRRYTWARRLMAVAVLLGLAWVALASAYWWTQQQYYVGEHEGQVAVYRGIDGFPGLSSVYRTSDLSVDDLPEAAQSDVEEGIAADDYQDATSIVRNLAERMMPADDGAEE